MSEESQLTGSNAVATQNLVVHIDDEPGRVLNRTDGLWRKSAVDCAARSAARHRETAPADAAATTATATTASAASAE